MQVNTENINLVLSALNAVKPTLVAITNRMGGVVTMQDALPIVIIRLASSLASSRGDVEGANNFKESENSLKESSVEGFDGVRRFSGAAAPAIIAAVGFVINYLTNLSRAKQEGRLEPGTPQFTVAELWQKVSGTVSKEISRQRGGDLLGGLVSFFMANAAEIALVSVVALGSFIILRNAE